MNVLLLLRNEANNFWNDSHYNNQVPLINYFLIGTCMRYVGSKYLTIGYMKVVLVGCLHFSMSYVSSTYPCVDYFTFMFLLLCTYPFFNHANVKRSLYASVMKEKFKV